MGRRRIVGEQAFVIVSNNLRNRAVEDVLGVRLTTAPKPDLPSIVRFGPGELEVSECYAVADDIWLARKECRGRQIGSLTPAQMHRIDRALQAALDLRL